MQRPSKQISVRIIREPAFTPMTERKNEVCWNFGIPPREEPFVIADGLTVELKPGGIVLLLGPSGSGKSSILQAIASQAGEAVWVGRGKFPAGRAIVDAIAPKRPLSSALEILTACGLGEPRLWVRQYADLSDGERFRASLARAVGQSLGQSAAPIFCDEFTAILHRRMAKAVAHNLRKLVSRRGLTLVVATTHEDVVHDLQPDRIVRLGGALPRIDDQRIYDKTVSLQRHARIEPGSVRDYRTFAPMHYRHRDGLGFVDKVFLLKVASGGDPVGILVFAHAPMELALRNASTEGRFKRNIRRLNKELRILRRLVMHPDVRGCGLGHWFVQKTLPQVGVRFVECLAAMGAVNPVFEKAGMRCVGRCPLPRGRIELLARLRDWGVDPFAPDFPAGIRRWPRVRRLVEDTVHAYLRHTQGASRCRIGGRPPEALARLFRQVIGEPPMYYLWDRDGVYPRKPDPSQPAAPGSGNVSDDVPSPKPDASLQEGPAAPNRSPFDQSASPDADRLRAGDKTDRHDPRRSSAESRPRSALRSDFCNRVENN